MSCVNLRKKNFSHNVLLNPPQKCQAEIFARGPIACDISVSAKFEAYDGGIFTQKRLLNVPNHIIAVVGWGVEEGTGREYWVARNSWGREWGEEGAPAPLFCSCIFYFADSRDAAGFARVQMHKENLGIERGCSFGMPVLMTTLAKPSSQPQLPLPSQLSASGAPRPPACLRRDPQSPRLSKVTSPQPHVRNSLRGDTPPLSWDIRNVSGLNLASPNRNQHIPFFCGSCWAQSVAAALSDRVNLARRGAFPEAALSAQLLVDCVTEGAPSPRCIIIIYIYLFHSSFAAGPSRGCSGGSPDAAFAWAASHGLTDATCSPYLAKDAVCDASAYCSDCSPNPLVGCHPVASPKHVTAVVEHGQAWGVDQSACCWNEISMRSQIAQFSSVSSRLTHFLSVVAEIAARGPIVCGVCVSDDFWAYSGGLFRDKSNCTTESTCLPLFF